MPRAHLLGVAFILPFAGCQVPCADGYGRAADGNCYPLCGELPAPSDDSGLSDDSGGGAVPSEGGFFLEVTEAGSQAQDTCAGSFTVSIDLESTPAILGEFSCNFNGDLRNLPGAEGGFDGNFDEQGFAQGQLFGDTWLQDTWEGSYGDGFLIGELEGEASQDGFTLIYVGQFSSNPPQE